MRCRALIPALIALVLPLAVGCGKSGSAPRINAGGATFVDPIMQKWSAEYKAAKNVEIDYVAKGSGYGISNVTSKNIDFGCSDAPMNAKDCTGGGRRLFRSPAGSSIGFRRGATRKTSRCRGAASLRVCFGAMTRGRRSSGVTGW